MDPAARVAGVGLGALCIGTGADILIAGAFVLDKWLGFFPGRERAARKLNDVIRDELASWDRRALEDAASMMEVAAVDGERFAALKLNAADAAQEVIDGAANHWLRRGPERREQARQAITAFYAAARRHFELLRELKPEIYARLLDIGERTLERVEKIEAKLDQPAPEPTLQYHLAAPPTGVARFVGREAEIAQLQATLAEKGKAVLTQAIVGLGGVGKTQTAIRLAQGFAGRVLWFAAEDPQAVAARWAQLAPGEGGDQASRAALAIAMAQESAEPHLIVYDNAESAQAIHPFLFEAPQARFLITSRDQRWDAVAAPLILDKLPIEDAVALLAGAPLEEDDPRYEAAAGLAFDLDRLPLALAQAAAYVREHQMSVAEYREDLARDRDALLADGRAPVGYPLPVHLTFARSIDAAEREAPGAAALLEILSWFAPDPIPASILDDALPPPLNEKFPRRKALAALANLSLLTRDPDNADLTLHRLVRAAAQAGQNDPTRRQRLETAIEALARALPEENTFNTPATWPWMARIAAHAERLSARAEQEGVATVAAALIATKTKSFHDANGAYGAAEPLACRALALAEAAHGPDSAETATRLNNLANLLRQTGRFDEAEPLYRRAIEITEKSLGPDHPNLATWLNNLANLFRDTGRVGEAEPLYRRAIEITEKSLGPDHPNLAGSFHNLASLLAGVGQAAEALPLAERAVAILARALPPEHPHQAVFRANLAQIRAALEG